MNHTPGQWKALLIYEYQDKRTVQLVADGRGVAIVQHDGSEEGMANERLLCTASDGYDLATHIMAMADDAYLTGHPEWDEIVKEAKNLLTVAKEGRNLDT